MNYEVENLFSACCKGIKSTKHKKKLETAWIRSEGIPEIHHAKAVGIPPMKK